MGCSGASQKARPREKKKICPEIGFNRRKSPALLLGGIPFVGVHDRGMKKNFESGRDFKERAGESTDTHVIHLCADRVFLLCMSLYRLAPRILWV